MTGPILETMVAPVPEAVMEQGIVGVIMVVVAIRRIVVIVDKQLPGIPGLLVPCRIVGAFGVWLCLGGGELVHGGFVADLERIRLTEFVTNGLQPDARVVRDGGGVVPGVVPSHKLPRRMQNELIFRGVLEGLVNGVDGVGHVSARGFPERHHSPAQPVLLVHFHEGSRLFEG